MEFVILSIHLAGLSLAGYIVNVGGQSCDFESGFCDWTNAPWSDGNWTRTKYSTKTGQTGPSTGHTKAGKNFYIYLEVNDFKAPSGLADTGKGIGLISPLLKSRACFRFFYHMYGVGIGNLTAGFVDKNYARSEVWSKAGNQNDTWHCAVINISGHSSTKFRVYIDARVGDNLKGDIAVDDLQLYTAPCTVNRTECITEIVPSSSSSLLPSTSVSTSSSGPTPPMTTESSKKTTTESPVFDLQVLYYIIAAVGAVVLVAVIIAAVCYYRKSTAKTTSLPQNNATEEEVYDVIDERTIDRSDGDDNNAYDEPVERVTPLDDDDYIEPVSNGIPPGGPVPTYYTHQLNEETTKNVDIHEMNGPAPCGTNEYLTIIHTEHDDYL